MTDLGQIKTVAIVGTGVIGSSWAVVFLAAGLRCLISDPDPSAEEKTRQYIKAAWPVMEKKSGADADNWKWVGGEIGEWLKEADFVQESAPENVDLKTTLYGQLDKFSRPEVPLCSSSSGLASSDFISQCKHSSRVLIAHPFNPPHIMPLVEIVPNQHTDRDLPARISHFFSSLGKTPITLSREIPGHVANRLQVALNREAQSLVINGVCSAKDVDTAIVTSLGPRWALTGPFMTAILGGGGNPGGYVNMATRLGPAMRSWAEDMDKVKFMGEPEKGKKLVQQVTSELGAIDTEALTRERDELLVEVIRLRAKTQHLSKYNETTDEK